MNKPNWLLRILKRKTKSVPVPGIDAAFDEARERREAMFRPVMPTAAERQIILQFHWARVHPDSPVPDGFALEALVPSTMAGDGAAWFHGIKEAAKMSYVRTLNQSWSKTELCAKLATQGLASGIELFDEGNRRAFTEGVINNLSD